MCEEAHKTIQGKKEKGRCERGCSASGELPACMPRAFLSPSLPNERTEPQRQTTNQQHRIRHTLQKKDGTNTLCSAALTSSSLFRALNWSSELHISSVHSMSVRHQPNIRTKHFRRNRLELPESHICVAPQFSTHVRQWRGSKGGGRVFARLRK